MYTYYGSKHTIMLHLQVQGPTRDCITQIVAVAHVHIWAHGQVLGIKAQLQAFGFLLSPCGEGAVVDGGREGGKGVQKHTSFQRDARKFCSWGQKCFYQQKDRPKFTHCVSKCDSNSHMTSRNTCAICSYIRGITAFDLVDRLKYRYAKLSCEEDCSEDLACVIQSIRVERF